MCECVEKEAVASTTRGLCCARAHALPHTSPSERRWTTVAHAHYLSSIHNIISINTPNDEPKNRQEVFGSAAPEPKRRFVPSKWEAMKVHKIVQAIKEGRMKVRCLKVGCVLCALSGTKAAL